MTTKRKQYTKTQIEALKKRALKLWKADNTSAFELGKALLAVRAALRRKHGAFRAWWEDHRLIQSRVSYCMDLASGKLAKRKTKVKTKTNAQAATATRSVSQTLNRLFNSCTGAPNVDAIRALLKQTIGETLEQTAKLAGWKLDTPETKTVVDSYSQALTVLISTISKPKAAGAASGGSL